MRYLVWTKIYSVCVVDILRILLKSMSTVIAKHTVTFFGVGEFHSSQNPAVR